MARRWRQPTRVVPRVVVPRRRWRATAIVVADAIIIARGWHAAGIVGFPAGGWAAVVVPLCGGGTVVHALRCCQRLVACRRRRALVEALLGSPMLTVHNLAPLGRRSLLQRPLIKGHPLRQRWIRSLVDLTLGWWCAAVGVAVSVVILGVALDASVASVLFIVAPPVLLVAVGVAIIVAVLSIAIIVAVLIIAVIVAVLVAIGIPRWRISAVPAVG